jgi:thiol:disulfide interchange protein
MMNTTRIQIVGSLLLLVLLGQGCAPLTTQDTQLATPEVPQTQKTIGTSTYEPFTKTKYDEARNSGKPIFLFFYANWCPTCREQEPRLQRIIPTHTGDVVGFRVNYNDTEVDTDEKALAKEFGVTYQHTGFFIGSDGATKKKTIGTITDAQTLEYLDLISN